MKNLFLTKIRLSWYLFGFFIFYFVILFFLPRLKFEGAALTLFSVNSFLYGFYITPVLSTQKARIEELHKIIRAEANAVFAMMLTVKDLSAKNEAAVKSLFDDYLKEGVKGRVKQSEAIYESLITFCITHQGTDKQLLEKLLEKLVANQQNRTNLSMQLANRVYSNEWWVMMMLFSITLAFILLIDTGDQLIMKVVTALLCTGLSMLIVNLLKLNTLTHKKAKQIWVPFKTLLETKYYRID